MTPHEFSTLARRIQNELAEIQRILARVQDGWESARRSNDDLYLDSVALNLHGLYSGFERIFAQIAETIDGKLPRNENWHELLLRQMRSEIKGIRPAVISAETGVTLDNLRKFRHIVRNVYTHHLDPARLEKLIHETVETLPQLEAEITAFIAFLQQA